MWVEFVVGSCPWFFSGFSGFPFASKSTSPNSNSEGHRFVSRTVKCHPRKTKLVYLFILVIKSVIDGEEGARIKIIIIITIKKYRVILVCYRTLTMNARKVL